MPVHEPFVGVTVYCAVTALVVVLVNVWLMELCPVDWAEPPVKPVPVGVVQV